MSTEPTVTVEKIDELPWGPGTVVLEKSLEIEVSVDSKTGHVTLFSNVIGQWGDGASYEDALLNFGMTIEDWVDAVLNTPQHLRDESLQKALDRLLEYLPEDIGT
jgi:hypothetical protein